MKLVSVELRANPISYNFCRFNQDSGVIPQAFPIRNAYRQ